MENIYEYQNESDATVKTYLDDNLTLGAEMNITNSTQQWLITNPFVQAFFCVWYTIIFVFGVFGNVLVCYVVFRNKAMQTVTNLFITNLALSDILLCTLAVPFTPLYTFLRGWIFGRVLCHLVPYAQGCSVYISTLTLTSIAIDRFFVIIYPFHPRMKLSTCISIIISIWVISLLVTMPYGLYMKLVFMEANGEISKYCEEDWPSEGTRKTFSFTTTSLQFVVPFIVISVCYILVSIKLNDRAKTAIGNKSSKKEEADRDRKKRTNRMLISMVTVFGISWLPLNVVNMCNDFFANITEWPLYTFSFFLAHSVAMSSTCYNTFLYAWLNENFRKEFKQVLPGFHASQRTLSGTRKWRSEQTGCNGNETGQESLLLSSNAKEIIPRGPTFNDSIKARKYPNAIALPEVASANDAVQQTKVHPTGVLETPFDVIVTNNLDSDGSTNTHKLILPNAAQTHIFT